MKHITPAQYILFLNISPAVARVVTPTRSIGTYYCQSRLHDAPSRNTDLTITHWVDVGNVLDEFRHIFYRCCKT